MSFFETSSPVPPSPPTKQKMSPLQRTAAAVGIGAILAIGGLIWHNGYTATPDRGAKLVAVLTTDAVNNKLVCAAWNRRVPPTSTDIPVSVYHTSSGQALAGWVVMTMSGYGFVLDTPLPPDIEPYRNDIETALMPCVSRALEDYTKPTNPEHIVRNVLTPTNNR